MSLVFIVLALGGSSGPSAMRSDLPCDSTPPVKTHTAAEKYVMAKDNLLEATSCTPFGCDWTVTVSLSGTVSVLSGRVPHRDGKYGLTIRALAELKATLAEEDAINLSGSMGDLPVDWTARGVWLRQGTRTTEFGLHATPPGLSLIYETDVSPTARAIRVCEAIRGLVRDPEAHSCVDAL